MKKITNALSNNVFLDKKNKKIRKEYLNDEFKNEFGNQEIIVLKKLNRFFTFQEKEQTLIMDYIENTKQFNDENIDENDLKMVSSSLKELHKNNIDELSYPNFEKCYYNVLLNKVDIIDNNEKIVVDKALKLLKNNKQVLLHNDVVEGNLLIKDNKIILIDFEYSGKGNYLFDLASFITERELTKDQMNFFIKEYNPSITKEELYDLKIISKFLQMFWYKWATLKFENTNKNIYKLITYWKLEKYKDIVL